jgi:adenine-specific DNA-methyltransferase
MAEQAINSWGQQLGLVATPLFGRERRDVSALGHMALLDGVRASFLISDESDDEHAAADWAWSSDVRHHVLLRQKQVVVTRASGSRDTLERRSVESKLVDFLRYLELDSDSQKIVGAVDHLLKLFRRHRTTLRQSNVPQPPDIQSFLYLLALAEGPNVIDAHQQGDSIAKKYALIDFDPTELDEDYVYRFVEDVQLSSVSMRRLLTPLTVRHAGGALFQEAQAEIISEPHQMSLFGLADAARQRLDLLRHGVYYTPPGLARTLTEIAIEPYLNQDAIRISDPACGSGIFLCEAIRALQRRKYAGKITLVGYDISPDAVQMAHFSIACALLDWSDNQVDWNVEASDFFRTARRKKKFDVVLMNPPFLSWDALTVDQKDFVRNILGSTFAGKPDLSTAFVQAYLGHLAPAGTLATLIPRGVLDSQRGGKWRDEILSRNDVRLIGTFGEHGLFRHAMVSIAAVVFQRQRTNSSTVMIWADERPNSAEGALRALRRQGSKGLLVDDRSNNWSVYSIKPGLLRTRKSWLPTPNALGSTLDIIEKNDLPRVEQLFAVWQGIKTGLKEALVISGETFMSLDEGERKFFRKVANGDDIVGGRILASDYIFYVPKLFNSEREMLKAVPKFGQKLLQYKSALKKRTYVDPKLWWEVFRPKTELAAPTPRILTKMFGALNMAAVDAKGEFLPLQAFAWMPNRSFLKIDEGLEEAALWWYCRILNSRIFFLLRREFAAAITAGGQLDVSRKYVDDVPIPVPTQDELIRLASFNKPDVSASRKNDEIVAASYGTRIESWPTYETN